MAILSNWADSSPAKTRRSVFLLQRTYLAGTGHEHVQCACARRNNEHNYYNTVQSFTSIYPIKISLNKNKTITTTEMQQLNSNLKQQIKVY